MTNDRIIEKLRLLINQEFDKNYSFDELKSLVNLSELMVSIACGELVCKSCGEKFKIYGIKGHK